MGLLSEDGSLSIRAGTLFGGLRDSVGLSKADAPRCHGLFSVETFGRTAFSHQPHLPSVGAASVHGSIPHWKKPGGGAGKGLSVLAAVRSPGQLATFWSLRLQKEFLQSWGGGTPFSQKRCDSWGK